MPKTRALGLTLAEQKAAQQRARDEKRRDETARRLRSRMTYMGLDQKDLGPALGVSASAVSRRLKDVGKIDTEDWVRLFRKLQLTLEDAAVIFDIKQ